MSPFILPIKGDLGIRWYGFMYVLGFIGAYLLIQWFVKLRTCELKNDRVGDFITTVALLGVMLGGRLGYMLIYNWGGFSTEPLTFFNIMGGGMASHGAIFGITAVTYFFARWQNISWLGLGDHIVITGPLGVFFGRFGNFINGELYGRKTDHPWGIKFVSEVYSMDNQKLLGFVESSKEIAPELLLKVSNLTAAKDTVYSWDIATLVIEATRKNDALQTMLADQLLNPRHPSQIYQALFEGLLVFLILLAIRLRWKNAYHGFISGVFFVSYAIARITVENLRQPDSSFVMGITKGQFYSVIMLFIGAGFIGWSLYRKQQNSVGAERA